MTALTENDVFEATYAINSPREVTETVIQKCLPINLFQEYHLDPTTKILGITSSVAPSDIIKAFQKHGLDGILRGSGKPNSSAVTILEDFTLGGKVEGLVRIVQVNDTNTMFDISINGPDLCEGDYSVAINENGDISKGLTSTGNAFHQFKETLHCKLEAEESIVTGHVFWSAPIQTWEIIGRSIVIKQLAPKNNDNVKEIGGIIARTAGAWENSKEVCACTGKTVWQERKEARDINIH